MSNIVSWRKPNPHRPPGGGPSHSEAKDVPATRFFDRMSFIGNEWIGCFVIETSEGLIMIDCLEPEQRYVDMIETGAQQLGLDLNKLKAILITHGHFDHYGHADYFRSKYGAKLYMSAVDEADALSEKTWRPPGRVPLPFAMDGHIEDGDVFRLGDTAIHIVSTPGHTRGCLSFIIPVTDEGRPHLAALWGGTGVTRERSEQLDYLASSQKFRSICEQMNVDVEIATHPFVDQTPQRLAVCREIVDGVANPFVIGKEAALRYQDMFTQMCRSKMQ